MSSGAIRQMRYCTGNVVVPKGSKTHSVTLLMPALDQNKVLCIPFAERPISNGPFNGSWNGKAYFTNITKINNGVQLSFYNDCICDGYSSPESKTFTYQFYLIEFY